MADGYKCSLVRHLSRREISTGQTTVVLTTPPAVRALLVLIAPELHRQIWRHKTKVPGLSCGVVILSFAIFIELQLVTDRWMDKQTDIR